MTNLPLVLITVFLTISLIANAGLFLRLRSRSEELEGTRRYALSVIQSLSQRVNYLRGLLSRPWVDRHGRLHATITR